jgi:hypothetical protein
MMKTYMVVSMPRESFTEPVLVTKPTYEDAFDLFNEMISQEGKQLFKMPLREPPLRAALSDVDIELWIVNRADELFKD